MLNMWLFFHGFHVGKYTSPMECLGPRLLFHLPAVPFLNNFAHIPWEDTPDFPKPPQKKKFLYHQTFQVPKTEVLTYISCM